MPTRPDPDADLLPDDEELDLPPPDAEVDEDEGEAHHGDDEIDAAEEGGLDDGEARDLDVGGDEIDTSEEDGEDDGREVDVGPLDEDLLVDEEAEARDEVEAAADTEGIDLDDEAGEDDGGAEGTSEDPGDGIDEGALPELDDDGGGEDGDELAETLLAESDAALPWAEARWAPLEGAGAEVPCRAVACAGGRVAAAGEVLLLVEEGGRAPRRLGFAEGSAAVALGEDAILAATSRGQLFAARGGGEEATALGSWRAGVPTSLGLRRAEAGAPSVELCATLGRFWIRAGGALLCCASPGQPPTAVRERGVLAVAAAGGVLFALTLGADGPLIERFRSDDEGWSGTALYGAAREMAARDEGPLRLAAAAAGRAVALNDAQHVAVSRDGGATFTFVEVGAVHAMAFAGDGAEAPLLALIAPTPAAAFLVEIDADAQPSRVAELPALPPGSGAAMAWDAAREVVWIASDAGLVALGRPQKH
jgi:hypothetical protein